jgi:hypothetical protein
MLKDQSERGVSASDVCCERGSECEERGCADHAQEGKGKRSRGDVRIKVREEATCLGQSDLRGVVR